MQLRNDQMVELLSSDFLRRSPDLAHALAAGRFSGLPALRAYWTCGQSDNAGNLLDLGGNALNLTRTGSGVLARRDLAPLVDMVAADYYLHADDADLDVTGSETSVSATYRGLAIGGWFRVDSIPGSDVVLVGKWDSAAATSSYALMVDSSGNLLFRYYSIGPVLNTVTLSGVVAAGEWFFACGVFDPSTSATVFHNGTSEQDTSSIPAAILATTGGFAIGARSDGSQGYDGGASNVFVCAADLGPGTPLSLYQHTRVMYGG